MSEGEGNIGFSAATELFGDMLGMGVIDAAKVTRLALQNAASVAGLLLTTQAAVVWMPDTESRKSAVGEALDCV